jgi:rare lipoprotein A
VLLSLHVANLPDFKPPQAVCSFKAEGLGLRLFLFTGFVLDSPFSPTKAKKLTGKGMTGAGLGLLLSLLTVPPACAGELTPSPPVADVLSVPRVEAISPQAPNRPYSVRGKRYEPLAADVPFRERGRSSWYGMPFHGRPTASGEIFNMHAMTAAHPTLPIPSYVRVRRVGGTQWVIVRINDRGPFHTSRVMDLSYAAAASLGMLGQGTAEVEIERLTFDDIRAGRWQQADEPVLAQATPPAAAFMAPSATNDPVLALIEMTPAAGAADPVDTAADAVQQTADIKPQADAVSVDVAAPVALYWVQLAAFDQTGGVEGFRQRMQRELGDLAQALAIFKAGTRTHLQLGPYPGPAEAAVVARRVRSLLQLVPVIVQRS